MNDQARTTFEAVTMYRRGSDPPWVEPSTFLLTPASFGISSNRLPPGRYRLRMPPGWSMELVDPTTWRVFPGEIDPDRWLIFTLEPLTGTGPNGERQWGRSIPVRLDLQTNFDPLRHVFPLANRASVLGNIEPRYDIFSQTYRSTTSFLQRILFQGLYSDIVYLREEGPQRGGLCSGMARWASARGLGLEPDPASNDQALERIMVLHGRQLTDRALLAGVSWFLRGSPRAAYRAVRDDLLRSGSTDRSLDIAVPKLWRRDIKTALVREGHTVVPYRIVQKHPGRAWVHVYDPNRPPTGEGDPPEVIELDLDRDRYSYRSLVEMAQSNVSMIAVRQRAYTAQGTAWLATIGSAFLIAYRAGRRMLARRK